MIKTKRTSDKRAVNSVKKTNEIKNFKAVEWVRSVRDEMYEKNKKLSMKEYVKAILKD